MYYRNRHYVIAFRRFDVSLVSYVIRIFPRFAPIGFMINNKHYHLARSYKIVQHVRDNPSKRCLFRRVIIHFYPLVVSAFIITRSSGIRAYRKDLYTVRLYHYRYYRCRYLLFVRLQNTRTRQRAYADKWPYGTNVDPAEWWSFIFLRAAQ